MDSLTDEDTEHFALCKMNDTLGPSSINTDPFLDDIRNGFENDFTWVCGTIRVRLVLRVRLQSG